MTNILSKRLRGVEQNEIQEPKSWLLPQQKVPARWKKRAENTASSAGFRDDTRKGFLPGWYPRDSLRVMEQQVATRCSHYEFVTAEMHRADGETEAKRQSLRNPQSLRPKMKTFGFSYFHPFCASKTNLFWSRGDS